MYDVLMPIADDAEGPTAACETVAALPRDPSALNVTMLSVFEEFSAYDDMGGTNSEDVFDNSAVPDSVTASAEYLEDLGANVEIRHIHGNPAKVIVDVAEDLGVDMIAMGGRKRTRVGKVLFGSVTQGVLLNAECPVFVTMSE